jgi:hypothetical protein
MLVEEISLFFEGFLSNPSGPIVSRIYKITDGPTNVRNLDG